MKTSANLAAQSANGHHTEPLDTNGQPRLPIPELNDHLHNILPDNLAGYQWFADENVETTYQCAEALVQAVGEKQNNLAAFFAGAIADLYHRDRADRACSLIHDRPVPIRVVPRRITIDGDRYELDLNVLNAWSTEIPLATLPTVAQVVKVATPDNLYLATYTRKKRSYSRSYDPLIYAKYGEWYVKLAEWE